MSEPINEAAILLRRAQVLAWTGRLSETAVPVPWLELLTLVQDDVPAMLAEIERLIKDA